MKIRLKDVKKFNILLIKKGFNKKVFAEKTNLSTSSVTLISNGSRNPSPPVAKRIAEVLGVEFDEIFNIDITIHQKNRG